MTRQPHGYGDNGLRLRSIDTVFCGLGDPPFKPVPPARPADAGRFLYVGGGDSLRVMNHWGTDSGRPNPASGTGYGIDGCSGGWLYVAFGRSGEPAWGIVGAIEELVSSADDSDRIFVDIPIGLPTGPGGRLCDKEARRKLGGRFAGSVFPAPVRAALAAATYEDANRISREKSGKGMTRQTFAILTRIREVDGLLRRSEKARHIVREVHPEICFWALAGGSPLSNRKKTDGGFHERFALLKGFRPSVGEEFARMRTEFRCWDVADDDILDAMAAAITASADPVALKTLPEHPTIDSRGLPMEMVYVTDLSPHTGRIG